jgi:hypothetical protein
LKKFLLVTNAGASGSTWHIFREGEDECICRTHSHIDVNRNTPKKEINEDELVDMLRNDESPGLGDWSGRCRRKAFEELTGEKQFSCDFCGKGISTRSGLMSHISSKHEKSNQAAREMVAAKGGI